MIVQVPGITEDHTAFIFRVKALQIFEMLRNTCPTTRVTSGKTSILMNHPICRLVCERENTLVLGQCCLFLCSHVHKITSEQILWSPWNSTGIIFYHCILIVNMILWLDWNDLSFWDVTSCELVNSYREFEGTCCFQFQGLFSSLSARPWWWRQMLL